MGEKLRKGEEGAKCVAVPCWHNCGGRCLVNALVRDGEVLRMKTDDLHQDTWERPLVRSCPMRALEFGDIDELCAKHAGEPLEDHCAAIANEDMANRNFIMRVKDCMMDPDFDEYLI